MGADVAAKPRPADARSQLAELERQMAIIELEQEALESKRVGVQAELEHVRRQLTHCPKCGRDKDFLTDEGGVLIHVLEDPDDTELLSANKPLFCPNCGEVFLYAATPAVVKVRVPTAKRKTA